MEKSQAANMREYLDMDTDEEEFGKQETPEPEEELEIEPDKPVFTEDQLKTLVQCVKDFTTLSNLEESNWSTEAIETVEEYFRNPSKTILTIFYESGTLKSFLDFPESADGGLTYFLRSPWQVYTPENFHSTVIFGSIDDRVENSTLKFVDNLYAPIAFRSNEWPVVIRNEVFTNLHEFLMCLTNATYGTMGLTILYVPREGLEEKEKIDRRINDESKGFKNLEKKCVPGDNEAECLIERLERVARNWIRQIREVLNGNCTFGNSSPCKTIVDEIRYWQYSCVHHQLTNKSVVSIVKKLEDEGSASVKQYNPLLAQVNRILNEASSNITYLNLLEEFDRGFDTPKGVEEYATRIFLLIRFIGVESLFYHGNEKLEKLCRGFGTQVVEKLQIYANLDTIFDGDPREGKKKILECIDCCDKIRKIYKSLVLMDRSSDKPAISLTDEPKIFNHVNTFVQRCNDLIAIADSRMTFDISDKSIRICGPRGMELDKVYDRVEERFRAILCEIKDGKNDILDIVSANWHERFVKFKDGIKNVENMVKNWINDVFKGILNVEEGIEALYGIKRFTERANLRETLNDKWIQIWKLFSKELECCSILTKENSKLFHHSGLPPFSGNARIIRTNKRFLIEQYKMLIDASDWFDDCPVQNAITKNYKSVLAAMSNKEEALFLDWQKHLEGKKIDFGVISNKSILKKNDALQVNLEVYYLENIREISEWTMLDYEAKSIASKNSPTWQMLKSRYNKAEKICKLYNGIFTAISKFEKLLFPTSLDELEDTINLGFENVTWTSESFERFYTDCMEAFTKLQESLGAYRSIDRKINRLIREIGMTSLVNCERNLIDTLEESVTNFERDRRNGATKVVKKCEEILKLVLSLEMKITTNESQLSDHWKQWIDGIYGKLKNQLIKCTRMSLSSALEFLHADFPDTSSSQPEKIDVDLITIKGIESEIAKINASLFLEGFPVEEFIKVFVPKNGANEFFDCIDRDPESISLKRKIDDFFSPLYLMEQ